jgi:hypothetical protein
MSQIVLEAVTTLNILPSFENNLTVCQYGHKKKGRRAKLPKHLSCYSCQVFIHLCEVSQVKYFSCFLCILWNLY